MNESSVARPVPDLAALARRIVLQNAVQHGGKAEPKGLVGRVMGGHPEHRANPQGVLAALTEAAAAVNAMTPDEQKAALEAEAPEMLNVQKKEKREGLKPLPNVKGKVVMRFAPNPNGPLSLGHSRGVSILAEYQRMYDATMILRFDDTDPQVKPPLMDDKRGWNGYEMIQADYEWLVGRKPDKVLRASDRIGIYQDAARDLIRVGGAYVCNCDAETFKRLKDAKTPCPHRDQSKEHNLAGFGAMCDGTTEKGAAVLRIKTDIGHPHPGLRDWTAFRVVARDAIHPRERKGEIPKHHAWPLLDFQSAIEDHLQGVTHVIRGKDLMDSTRKQTFLYKHMGWTYPETLYWGRVSVHEFGKFSTSMMRRAIEAGRFTGWDDPRLPCLAALRRRGYDPVALRQFWVTMGLTEKDTAVSLANLDAEDSRNLDPVAPRYFFVPDPVEVVVKDAPAKVAHPPVHPGHPERGTRTLPLGASIHVAKPDLAPRFRLKDLGNVRADAGHPHLVHWDGDALERGLGIVQWLPAGHAKPFTVLRPAFEADEAAPAQGDDEAGAAGDEAERKDAKELDVPPLDHVKGLVEPAALRDVGKVVQFERFGFVRIESAAQGIWLHS